MGRSYSRSRSRSRSPRRKEKSKSKKKSKRKDKHREDRSRGSSSVQASDAAQESMSIEETNRIRVSLGLEPLVTPNSQSSAQKKQDAKVKQEEARKAKEDDEIRKDLARRKRERALKNKTGDGSLGEELMDLTGGSAADWVMRSRKIGKKKAAAGMRAALLAEQEAAASAEYDSADVKGLKVRHTMDDFAAGTTTILTLKDTPILADNGEIEMNREEDTLENVNMVDADTLEKNKKIKGQKKIYDATADEDVDSLLPQYNEDKEKEGMRLGDEDEDDDAKRLAGIRAKLRKADAPVPKVSTKTEYSLDYTVGVGTDYLPAEPAKFKKRRKKKKKDGKKKKEKFSLPEPSAEERAKDHGSRGASRKVQLDAEKAAQSQKQRDEGYLRALQKAEEDSRKIVEEFEQAFDDEEDAELQSSLDRARRLAADKKEKKKKVKEDEDYADPIKRLAERLQQMKEEQNEGDDDLEDEGMTVKAEGNNQVFTATTEFCRGLQDTVDEEKNKTAEDKYGFKPVEEEKEKTKKEKHRDFDPETEMQDEDEDNSDDESDKEEEDDTFINNESLANSGAASALSLMRSRGLLKQKVQQIGRANDGLLELEDAGSNISIVHLDEHGRPMKPKEAFRKLSHKFHGRGPSAQKLEKNLKKIREEARRKQNLSRNKSLTMNKLKKHQNQFREAYVVLEGEGATQAEPRQGRKERRGDRKSVV